MKKILIPLPLTDFDPTESAIPWSILKNAGHVTTFVTPQAQVASCDPRMLEGQGLGLLAPILCANSDAKKAYAEMSASAEFQKPIAWEQVDVREYDALLLAGGHAKGMRPYLESTVLQKVVADFFSQQKLVAAICHGVVLAVRSTNAEGKSVLYGKKSTALLETQEMLAYRLTCLWLKDYYRTYPQTVEAEVKAGLKNKNDFLQGPLPLLRDDLTHLERGFVVEDGNYLSARWPGDAHLLGTTMLRKLS